VISNDNIYYPFVQLDDEPPTILTAFHAANFVIVDSAESVEEVHVEGVFLEAFSGSNITFGVYYEGTKYVRSFYLPDDQGILNVSDSETGLCSILVSAAVLTAAASASGLSYELEPCNTVWYLDHISKIHVHSEERLYSSTEAADILSVAEITDSFNLKEGFNVSVSQISSELRIVGGARLGKGLTPDNGYLDYTESGEQIVIRSINGQSPDINGNFTINGSHSLMVTTSDNKITIKDNARSTNVVSGRFTYDQEACATVDVYDTACEIVDCLNDMYAFSQLPQDLQRMSSFHPWVNDISGDNFTLTAEGFLDSVQGLVCAESFDIDYPVVVDKPDSVPATIRGIGFKAPDMADFDPGDFEVNVGDFLFTPSGPCTQSPIKLIEKDGKFGFALDPSAIDGKEEDESDIDLYVLTMSKDESDGDGGTKGGCLSWKPAKSCKEADSSS
jgi:hypothetical protein